MKTVTYNAVQVLDIASLIEVYGDQRARLSRALLTNKTFVAESAQKELEIIRSKLEGLGIAVH